MFYFFCFCRRSDKLTKYYLTLLVFFSSLSFLLSPFFSLFSSNPNNQNQLTTTNNKQQTTTQQQEANIPVTTTIQGMGAFDELSPLSLHMLGMHGSAYANNAMQKADLILALGAR